MNKKILHVIKNDKFIKPFIEFIENNFEIDEHTFLYFGGGSLEEYPLPEVGNIIVVDKHMNKYKKVLLLLKYFNGADKIILHSLFERQIVKFLYTFPWLLKKCYWVMWGGDLYYHVLAEKNDTYLLHEKWRKKVISNMHGLITYMPGTYELAQKWYGATGEYHECFLYPSNLYKEYNIKLKSHTSVNIQVGNSADPTNNHLEIFEKLEKYKDKDINIYVPLSYGDPEYAKEVIRLGTKMFDEKFKPLIEFMPFEEYLEFLTEIDIAIFAHKRQQGMGNIITLLGLGKKIYMRNDIPPWKLFEDIDVKIFDVESIDLCFLEDNVRQNNKKHIKEYFSKKNYKKQLNNLFES